MKHSKIKPPVVESLIPFVNKKAIPQGSSFTALPTSAEIHSRWCAKAKTTKLDDGSNSHVDRFMQVIDRIRATQKSFYLSDVIKMCRNFELELSEINFLWTSYKEFAVQHCILEEVSGCMDESTFFWNSN